MSYFFSFIIPVYNRPDEVRELLNSFTNQDFKEDYEIVLVEDGSSVPAEDVVREFPGLPVSYFFKQNSGPGPSRNYGMQHARGNYFIILDSDCLLPSHYLTTVQQVLDQNPVDFYGGPDAAHDDFSSLQKAINYSMTSVLTTGGIRGKKKAATRFQPRSFNMGMSKEAFEASDGFGKIHPGEDPDLTLRLWQLGFNSRFIKDAYVYHKRRISWKLFYKQVRKFGLVRPILNLWHPGSAKIVFWLPTLFTLGAIFSLLLWIVGIVFPVLFLLSYLVLIGIHASIKTSSVKIGGMAILACLIQLTGYGVAFLESTIAISWQKKLPQKHFPHLFFD